ncbi:MerR family transcriptional regulator [Actinomycetospora chibensis]|uniref:MerR family transcriptional regulator n=1 Tax=Actinomycetospora chibensis TaxID=663606 RepID=A0ABV9RU45_9PSEU|nr:MerR family transcriptional regulator [Actinomycetospora chibensis]MDD7923168.1 MerR family transcriptional regulator [Actinomycetospora chibensis]
MSVTTERLRDLIETTPGELPPLTVELVRDLDIAEHLAIADVAALTGLSAHTLRYYERIGLVDVARDASGRRVYDRDAVGRVVFITRLRDSDMPIASIARYVELVKQGPDTEAERLALLEAHRADMLVRLRDLQAALAVVDYKITTYGGACGG